MIWGPDTSHTLVDTGNRLLGALQLLAAGFLQQVRLLENLFGLQISNADRLLTTVDVVTLDDGVLVRPGGYSDFDLRVGFGEVGEGVFQEGAGKRNVSVRS